MGATSASLPSLSERMFGPGSLDEAQKRRSIYFTIKRSQLVPIMMLFDAPDSLQSLGIRSSTTIAPQESSRRRKRGFGRRGREY